MFDIEDVPCVLCQNGWNQPHECEIPYYCPCPQSHTRGAIVSPSLRHGLTYGWWKSSDFWMSTASLILLIAVAAGIAGAWTLDWKAWW